MPVSRINGVNINWRVVGDHGPWVVMTTGGRRGYDEFIPLAEKVAQYGFRIMLHDRRNTGASDILIQGADGEEAIWTRDVAGHRRRVCRDEAPVRQCARRCARANPTCRAPVMGWWRR